MAKKFSAILKQNTYKSETINGKTKEESSSAEYFDKNGMKFRKINNGNIEIQCDGCGSWYDEKVSKCPDCGLTNPSASNKGTKLQEAGNTFKMFDTNSVDSLGTNYWDTMDIAGYRRRGPDGSVVDIRKQEKDKRAEDEEDRANKEQEDQDKQDKKDADFYTKLKAAYDKSIDAGTKLLINRIEKTQSDINAKVMDIDTTLSGLSTDNDKHKYIVGLLTAIRHASEDLNRYHHTVERINATYDTKLKSGISNDNYDDYKDKFDLDKIDPDDVVNSHTTDLESLRSAVVAEDPLSSLVESLKNRTSDPSKHDRDLSSIEESMIFGSSLDTIDNVLSIDEAANKPNAGNLNKAEDNARKSRAAWMSGKGNIIDVNRTKNIANTIRHEYMKKDDIDPVSGQPLKEDEDATKKNVVNAIDSQINSAMRNKTRIEQTKQRNNDRLDKSVENIDNRLQRLRQQKSNITGSADNDSQQQITESDNSDKNKPEVIATSSDGKDVYLLDKNKNVEKVDPDELSEDYADRNSADIRREKHTTSQFNIYSSEYRPDYNTATADYKYPANAVSYVKNKYYPVLSSGDGGKLLAAMVFGDDIPEEDTEIYNQMKLMAEVKACVSEITIAIKRLIKSGEKDFDSATNNSIMAQKSNFVNIYKQVKDK